MFSINTDRQTGMFVVTVVAGFMIYNTIWLIITPFVDADQILQEYFPSRLIAIVVPIVSGLAVLTIVFSFIALVMIHSNDDIRSS